ncbi:unnamed protein product [Paramecium pentaurelia]|uniref:Uncharacterized protein n=1 Tax=Paramecium pentaurelia TaxID=43138 RepID=A0A8S1U7A3_9CILI|nr:unnamed protein product [Paramecium pentaurelia]
MMIQRKQEKIQRIKLTILTQNYHSSYFPLSKQMLSLYINFSDIQGIKRQFLNLKETQLQVIYIKEIEMIYLQDGEILRCNEIQDFYDKPQIMKDLQQIKQLNWHDQYNLNSQKEGKRYPTWKGEKLDVGGDYLQNGLKNGEWKKLSQNLWDKAQVFEKGKYENNKKCGVWYIIHNNQLLALIHKMAQKMGDGLIYMKIIMKGINSFLMESIWKDKRLTSGIYYKRGDKLMEDIIIKQEKKEGNWIELHNNFNEYKYIQNVEIIKQLSQENKKMETELNNGILNLKEKKLVVDDTLSKEIRMEYGKNYITIILIIQLVIMNRDNVTFLIGQYNNAKKCNQWKILFKSEKESQQEIIKGNHNENQIKIDEQIDLHQSK